MPIARRQSLLQWAAERDGYLIEDDYDSEFRFTGRPIPSMQSVDHAGRVIYVNTFSRSLAPSFRLSYMVLPPPLLEVYRARLGFYSSTVPVMEQQTLARFLDEGYFESHVNRMRVFYRDQRDQVIRAIQASPLAGRCTIFRQDAGLHFLLRLETAHSDGELSALAQAQGIRLSFLSDYQQQPGAAQPHILVVNYPGVALAHLDKALEILAALN
jgi:GntR family transcriptional regulator/MocR family aminotransferase